MGTTSIKLITSDGVELGWGEIPDTALTFRSDTLVRGTELLTADALGNLTAASVTATNIARRGTATLDFGATPTDDGSIAVTGQAWVTAGSLVNAWVMRAATADNTADDHEALATFGQFIVSDVIAGTGFTLRCNVLSGFATGTFTVAWEGV